MAGSKNYDPHQSQPACLLLKSKLEVLKSKRDELAARKEKIKETKTEEKASHVPLSACKRTFPQWGAFETLAKLWHVARP